MRKKVLLLFIPLFIIVALLFSLAPTHASIFDNLADGVKNLFNKGEVKKEFTIESNITLVPDGDMDKNGEIDAGDIVRFTYTITNTTDQEYSFATLKTNIDRKQLNFIHNVIGTASLDDDGKTIEIPNVRIAPNQTATITFDARVNYYTNEDPAIATEAEFVGNDKKSIAKSSKKEIKAKRINKDKIPGMIKQQIKKESSQ